MAEHPDIFLVEDNEDDAALFIAALKQFRPSASVLRARDGAEALALLFGPGEPAATAPLIRPRLIALDLKLPKVGGVEVLSHLKINPHARSLPVVILSSSRENRDLDECYQLGANSYLVKPVDFDEFSEVLHMLGSYWLQLNQSVKS